VKFFRFDYDSLCHFVGSMTIRSKIMIKVITGTLSDLWMGVSLSLFVFILSSNVALGASLCEKYLAVERAYQKSYGQDKSATEAYNSLRKKARSEPYPDGNVHPELLVEIYFQKAILAKAVGDIAKAADFQSNLKSWYESTFSALVGIPSQVLKLSDGSKVTLSANKERTELGRSRGLFAEEWDTNAVWIQKGEAAVQIRATPSDYGDGGVNLHVSYWCCKLERGTSGFIFEVNGPARISPVWPRNRRARIPFKDLSANSIPHPRDLAFKISSPDWASGWSLDGISLLAQVLDAASFKPNNAALYSSIRREVENKRRELLADYLKKTDVVKKFKNILDNAETNQGKKSEFRPRIRRWKDLGAEMYEQEGRRVGHLLPQGEDPNKEWLLLSIGASFQIVSIEALNQGRLEIYLRNFDGTGSVDVLLPNGEMEYPVIPTYKLKLNQKGEVVEIPSTNSYYENITFVRFWIELVKLQLR
jgi:hypothetical protein